MRLPAPRARRTLQRGGGGAQVGQRRVDEPHHRYRAGGAGQAHLGRLSPRRVGRGAAQRLPQPGILPRSRGHRRRARAGRYGARRAGKVNAGQLIQAPRKAAIAAATRRPCARPASADGFRHAGSSGLLPNAASDSSSANTPNVDPANASTSSASPPPNGDGTERPDGTSTTATSQSFARTLLTMLPTPPSM